MQNKKFDSMAIRSFIRTMYEKGFIPEETVVKTASETIEISNNFNSNVLKLAEKLRSLDLKSYADDLEKNYLNFKLAEADLYKMFSETGEDLIEAAHGKNVRVDVPGDNLVENIVEQQLKNISIVRKNPTGKLSSIQAVNMIKSAQFDPYTMMGILKNFGKWSSGVSDNIKHVLHRNEVLMNESNISENDLGKLITLKDALQKLKISLDNFSANESSPKLSDIDNITSAIQYAQGSLNSAVNAIKIRRTQQNEGFLNTILSTVTMTKLDTFISSTITLGRSLGDLKTRIETAKKSAVPNAPTQEAKPQTPIAPTAEKPKSEYQDPMLLDLQDKYKKLTGVWKQIITNGTDVYTPEERGAALAWINDQSKLIGNFLRSNPTAEYIGSRQRAAMKEMIDDCNSFYGDYIA